MFAGWFPHGWDDSQHAEKVDKFILLFAELCQLICVVSIVRQ
jgi:hypothetical protein